MCAWLRFFDGCSHVILPKEIAKLIPKNKLLSEAEWRAYGVQQSRGWEHYAIHKPEPHILLFRRALGTDPTTGRVRTLARRAAPHMHPFPASCKRLAAMCTCDAPEAVVACVNVRACR